MKKVTFILVLLACAYIFGCKGKNTTATEPVVTGAEQPEEYLPLLKDKKVGMMGNNTSMIGDKHVADMLLENGVDLKFVFAPEHGFRGDVERGEKFDNEVDAQTGLPVYSLYGKNEKADSIVSSVDVMLFDIQDTGARFYTKSVSLYQVMQLCARNNKPLILLDRPNPNGDQVDGPVRKDDKFKSDVSFHKVAMVHGLTFGELAQMINGEGWLENGKPCELNIITLKGYTHKTKYRPPIAPSPSLTSYLAIRLYMSLCLFEGTNISVGRGTDFPFQVIGYPDPSFGDFTFTPGVRKGMSAHVDQQGEQCYGIDLRDLDPEKATFTLKYILDFYHKMPDTFFVRPEFFDKLAGTDKLREQIIAGWTEQQIRDSWKEELTEYKAMRKKYLLYEDFE